MTATTESYTIPLLESSYDNIPSCSWPNHSSDVVKWSLGGIRHTADISYSYTNQCQFSSLLRTNWKESGHSITGGAEKVKHTCIQRNNACMFHSFRATLYCS